MGRKCSVCEHSEISKIDQLLTSGCSLSDIARRFSDLSISSLHRHRAAGHIAISECLIKIEPEEIPELDADTIDVQVRSLVAESQRILKTASKQENHRLALAAVRESRHCLELAAKLVGALRGSPEPQKPPAMLVFPEGSQPVLVEPSQQKALHGDVIDVETTKEDDQKD